MKNDTSWFEGEDMNTERVLERLVYERVLLHNQLKGRRLRIRLPEVLEAGREEPRILEVLPAILKLRPQIVARAKKDLEAYPKLKKVVEYLWDPKAPREWEGILLADLRKQALRLEQIWKHRQSKTRWRNINIRVSEEDLERLESLSQTLGPRSKSELIRQLIARVEIDEKGRMRI
jgi:hypothetical protein